MKKMFLLAFSTLLNFSASYAQDGKIDSTFGTYGRTTTDFSGNNDQGKSIVVQNDGKYVLGGYANDTISDNYAMVRYNVNGSIDTTFGDKGKVHYKYSPSLDQAWWTLLQPDGKILLLGNTADTIDGMVGQEIRLARFLTNGKPDTSFGKKGITGRTGGGWTYCTVRNGVLQPDGKILVIGLMANAWLGNGVVMRYTAQGKMDSSFNGNGVFINNKDSLVDFKSITVQSDGKILIPIYKTNGSKWSIAVMRLLPNGTIDNTYGTAGFIYTAEVDKTYDPYHAYVLNDGKILAAGLYRDPVTQRSRFALVRFNANGSLDNGFGVAGKFMHAVSIHNDNMGANVLVQPDGKMLIGGTTSDSFYHNHAIVLRVKINGTLDSSFGKNGVTIIPNGNNSFFASVIQDMKLQADGNIIAGGFWSDDFDSDFSIIRIKNKKTISYVNAIKEDKIEVFPNPVYDRMTIRSSLIGEDAIIHIYDCLARLIVLKAEDALIVKNGVAEVILPEGMDEGTYYITITSADGRQVAKFYKKEKS